MVCGIILLVRNTLTKRKQSQFPPMSLNPRLTLNIMVPQKYENHLFIIRGPL